MTRKTGNIPLIAKPAAQRFGGRPFKWRRLGGLTLICAMLSLTSCAISLHQFAGPARDWQARSGQLLYRTSKTTLIGEVLVRFSKTGGFELTFSKGPGVTLLTVEQDETFAQIKGALAHGGWSGATATAPHRLLGWLGLRDELMRSQDKQLVRYVSGGETFIFRF